MKKIARRKKDTLWETTPLAIVQRQWRSKQDRGSSTMQSCLVWPGALLIWLDWVLLRCWYINIYAQSYVSKYMNLLVIHVNVASLAIL